MRTLLRFAALVIVLAVTGCARTQNSGSGYEAYRPAPKGSTNEMTLAALTAQAQAHAAAQQKNASATASEEPIVTPAEGLNGKVSASNSNLKFVVITFPVGQMAKVEQRLNVYREGLKVGELTVTGPQRDDSIVADIINGEAQKGDEVRDK